jgi:hypothetical protein
MMTVPAVQDWLATLATTGYVAVDLGGLNLVEVDENGKETGAYLELGGVRLQCTECGHDFTEADIQGGRCLGCGATVLPVRAGEVAVRGDGAGEPGELIKLSITTGMTVEMEQGLVRVIGRDGNELGLVEVDRPSAEKVVRALRLIAVGYGVDPGFSTTELACPDGGRVEIIIDGPAEDAGVYIQAPADSTHAEREVACWVGDEWEEDVEACTATLNAVALALSQGAVAVLERIEHRG